MVDERERGGRGEGEGEGEGEGRGGGGRCGPWHYGFYDVHKMALVHVARRS